MVIQKAKTVRKFSLANAYLIGIGRAGVSVVDNLIKANTAVGNIAVIHEFVPDLIFCEANNKYIVNGIKVEDQLNGIFNYYISEGNHFLMVAGLGCRTSSALSIQIAKIIYMQLNIMPDMVITLPYSFEGSFRMQRAIDCIKVLGNICNQVHIIPNQYLFSQFDDTTTIRDAYKLSDKFVSQQIVEMYK